MDIVVFVLTCWNALARPRHMHTAITKQLVTDGVVYFVVRTAPHVPRGPRADRPAPAPQTLMGAWRARRRAGLTGRLRRAPLFQHTRDCVCRRERAHAYPARARD